MLIRLLRTHLRDYRGALAAVVLFQLVQTSATLYLPSLNAHIIDRGIALNDHHYIWRTGLLMLGVTVVQIVFAVIAVYFGSRTAMGFGRDVRRNLFHQVTGYSAREINHFGPPSLITRITNDVQQVQMLVVMGCTMLVAAPLTMVGGVIMALREDVGLSALLLVSVPALVIAVGFVVVRLVPQFREMQTRIVSVNRILREQIIGIRVVRAFVREPDEVERFDEANRELTATSLRAGRLQARMFPTVMLVLNTSMVGAVWIGANRISSGKMQIGAMVAFLSYLIQILMSVMMATFVPAPRPVSTVAERGLLELRNVSFHYPGAEAPVVHNVSLVARAGETTAIIGSTGSGKTTLLHLVPRLFDATSGSVLVDGVDVRDLAPEVLWSRIGLVPQRPYLFSGTIATNLRFGDPNATDEELWKALEIAQAADFVHAMTGGLDSPINQGGTNVSGGQRQRLAIARALVHKPEIYLFDDSFSALDLATDARLRAALVPHTADAAVLIVGQRVSTISRADQILVLEDGEPVGLGTHAHLLETCPTYAEIVASQLTEEEAA
ncbi:MAG: ABC transporter ATP-binding protein [Actinobacteria bacterium]|nr:MAG: ABC transporter ATP-binding protein [Actinomycetota bacterium]